MAPAPPRDCAGRRAAARARRAPTRSIARAAMSVHAVVRRRTRRWPAIRLRSARTAALGSRSIPQARSSRRPATHERVARGEPASRRRARAPHSTAARRAPAAMPRGSNGFGLRRRRPLLRRHSGDPQRVERHRRRFEQAQITIDAGGALWLEDGPRRDIAQHAERRVRPSRASTWPMRAKSSSRRSNACLRLERRARKRSRAGPAAALEQRAPLRHPVARRLRAREDDAVGGVAHARCDGRRESRHRGHRVVPGDAGAAVVEPCELASRARSIHSPGTNGERNSAAASARPSVAVRERDQPERARDHGIVGQRPSQRNVVGTRRHPPCPGSCSAGHSTSSASARTSSRRSREVLERDADQRARVRRRRVRAPIATRAALRRAASARPRARSRPRRLRTPRRRSRMPAARNAVDQPLLLRREFDEAREARRRVRATRVIAGAAAREDIRQRARGRRTERDASSRR